MTTPKFLPHSRSRRKREKKEEEGGGRGGGILITDSQLRMRPGWNKDRRFCIGSTAEYHPCISKGEGSARGSRED